MRTISLRGLAGALSLLCLACSEPAGPRGGAVEADTYNVVLIGIDTLRADFLSCYGFPHPISPRIDRLASEGVLYTDVVAPSPWTLPSFASLLTGQYPSSHGAGARTGPQREGGEPPKSPIHSEVRLLPEILRDSAGFESAVFFDNPYLGEQWGMARGFDTVRKSENGGEESVERALDWIRNRGDRRTFVFLHLMEPHLPYEPPEPYRETARKWILDGKEQPPKGSKIRALYAGEVAYTDHLVGAFVDGLSELGLLDQTLLILTSDHGEEFYEHEEVEKRFYNDPRGIWGIGHGHSQFQELISVPLIIRFPGLIPAGVRIDSLAQLLDLAPSVLEWQGLEIPPDMDGVSLVPTLEGEVPRDHAFSEFILYGDDRRSYREGQWKLILGPAIDEAELYDLATDPGETVNLREERPQIFRRLARSLAQTESRAVALGQAQAGETAPVSLDEETLRELRALGYIE